MRFQWSQESIRWFRQAAEQGQFHKKVAELLRPYVTGAETLLDLGCGAGYLSMALSPYIKKIESVDRDRNVLQVLKESAQEKHISNIRPVCMPWRQRLKGEKAQILLMSFFGNIRTERQLREFSSLCEKRFIYIVNSDRKSGLSPSGTDNRKKTYTEDFRGFLDRNNILYECFEEQLEFGQPFFRMEEAAEFVKYYYPMADEKERNEFLDSHLMRIAQEEWYLPNLKKVGIFIIQKEEII